MRSDIDYTDDSRTYKKLLVDKLCSLRRLCKYCLIYAGLRRGENYRQGIPFRSWKQYRRKQYKPL